VRLTRLSTLHSQRRRSSRRSVVDAREPPNVALYAMISRMRVQSLPQTVACAEKIMRATIDTYFAPGKTIGEVHELVQSGSGIDLLKDFSEVAREELRAFTTL
jgi:hypothetical protein